MQIRVLKRPAVLSEAERLTRHLLVNIQGWHFLENFKAARLVRNKFSAGCVRLAFDLLAENEHETVL